MIVWSVFRDSLEVKRRHHGSWVMVPGLSAKALGAIETLKQAGADPRLVEQSKRVGGLAGTNQLASWYA